MRLKRFIKLAAVAASICAMTASTGHAQDYPSKTVTVIVPFAAGGNTDALHSARSMDVHPEGRTEDGRELELGAVQPITTYTGNAGYPLRHPLVKV